MSAKRTCRDEPLRNQPLVIALCQVRFSPVRQMGLYIPQIQEDFRRAGFPIERADRIQQMVLTPKGAQFIEQERWEYRNKDEKWSITVLQDSVSLQTTAYERFESFADRLAQAVHTVLTRTEQNKLGRIERIGLRYIDLIQPRPGEDHRFYLHPGLHGVTDAVFQPGSQRLQVVSTGRTQVDGTEGTLMVRISQNDQGLDLPLDLQAGVPHHRSRAKPHELVTIVDIDHFIEGNFEPDEEWILARTYRMHDHIVETFFEHIVTRQGVEAWR